MKNYNAMLWELVKCSADYANALEVVTYNASGGCVWLVGGSLYGRLAHALHGTPLPRASFDFVVERIHNNLITFNGWSLERNKYGGIKFSHGAVSVDLVALKTHHSISSREVEPTIKNYLTGTPLSIQSIAYNVLTRNVVGKSGISALESRTVEINNEKEAAFDAKQKGISVEEMVLKKAKSLNFTPILE